WQGLVGVRDVLPRPGAPLGGAQSHQLVAVVVAVAREVHDADDPGASGRRDARLEIEVESSAPFRSLYLELEGHAESLRRVTALLVGENPAGDSPVLRFVLRDGGGDVQQFVGLPVERE